MVLQQIHILEEMSLASLSQKEQFLVGLLFFSLVDILIWNEISSCQCFLDRVIVGERVRLAMALTPMTLTARLIKQQNKNAKVVFIGSCAAKKLEAMRRTVKSEVDFVLTVEELCYPMSCVMKSTPVASVIILLLMWMSSGKTTLLCLLMGLEVPDSGTILLKCVESTEWFCRIKWVK